MAIAASPVHATGIAVKVRDGKTTGETSEAKARRDGPDGLSFLDRPPNLMRVYVPEP